MRRGRPIGSLAGRPRPSKSAFGRLVRSNVDGLEARRPRHELLDAQLRVGEQPVAVALERHAALVQRDRRARAAGRRPRARRRSAGARPGRRRSRACSIGVSAVVGHLAPRRRARPSGSIRGAITSIPTAMPTPASAATNARRRHDLSHDRRPTSAATSPPATRETEARRDRVRRPGRARPPRRRRGARSRSRARAWPAARGPRGPPRTRRARPRAGRQASACVERVASRSAQAPGQRRTAPRSRRRTADSIARVARSSSSPTRSRAAASRRVGAQPVERAPLRRQLPRSVCQATRGGAVEAAAGAAEAATNSVAIGDDQLRGRRRRRGTDVGGEVGQRDIDLVAHAAHDGHGVRDHRPHDPLVVERPQVLERAAAAGKDRDRRRLVGPAGREAFGDVPLEPSERGDDGWPARPHPGPGTRRARRWRAASAGRARGRCRARRRRSGW